MNEASFVCQVVDLKPLVDKLYKLVPARMRKVTSIEIRIQPRFVSFHTPGAELKLFCSTAGWGSFSMSLPYFRQLVHDHGNRVFHPVFRDDELEVGGLFTKGLFTRIQSTHPEMRPSLDLPVNFRDIDLLRLHWQGREFDKSMLNADRMIEQAEERLKVNARKAADALKDYDISLHEIMSLIRSKAMRPDA